MPKCADWWSADITANLATALVDERDGVLPTSGAWVTLNWLVCRTADAVPSTHATANYQRLVRKRKGGLNPDAPLEERCAVGHSRLIIDAMRAHVTRGRVEWNGKKGDDARRYRLKVRPAEGDEAETHAADAEVLTLPLSSLRTDGDAIIDFIRKPVLEGLGTDVETLKRLLGDSPERGLLEDAIRRGPGGDNNPYGCKGKPDTNTTTNHNPVLVDSSAAPVTPSPPKPKQAKPKQGNSIGYLRSRLRALAEHERLLADPEPQEKTPAELLLEQVDAGKLKTKTAARMAGIVKTPTVLESLRNLWAKATDAEKAQFRQEIA